LVEQSPGRQVPSFAQVSFAAQSFGFAQNTSAAPSAFGAASVAMSVV
jgi:hypothetical protein